MKWRGVCPNRRSSGRSICSASEISYKGRASAETLSKMKVLHYLRWVLLI